MSYDKLLPLSDDDTPVPEHTRRQLDLEQLIDGRVSREASGCLLWQGPANQRGIPQIHTPEGIRSVHRLQMIRCFGPIPVGKAVGWTCGNKRCLEPSHLVLKSKRFVVQARAGEKSTSWKAEYMRAWRKLEQTDQPITEPTRNPGQFVKRTR